MTISAVDASLTGTVAAIAPTANSSSSNGSVVSYAVTVALEDAPAAVHPGMTSRHHHHDRERHERADRPGRRPARHRPARTRCWSWAPTGSPTAVPVEVGLVTNTIAEIKSGLTAGQTVVTGREHPADGDARRTGGGFGRTPSGAATSVAAASGSGGN